MTAVTDARTHALEFGYDDKGNPIRLERVDGTFETYVPDAQGNIEQAVNRRGTPVDYVYYPNGLLQRKT